jgi:hypothetical protein
MRTIVSSILLLVCVALIMPPSASGKRPEVSPVVAKFGGECDGIPLLRSPRLERLIKKTRQREVSPCDSPFCNGVFAYDLNGDGRHEYFVRLGCGATGNCTWGIFSDSPARLRGTFTAWFFYIHRRAGGWSALSTYTREGGDQGVIATLANLRGKYIQTSEHTERGYYGNPQPFLKRMGMPKCDISDAAQPNNSLNPTARQHDFQELFEAQKSVSTPFG